MKLARVFVALAGSVWSMAPAWAAQELVYSGELFEFGEPANGAFDLQLVAFASREATRPLAGQVIMEDVSVVDGRFQVELDFGWLPPDAPVWIELSVRDGASSGAFSGIPGRQQAETPSLIGQCWSSTGDAGTNPSVNFIGTTDGQPLVLRSTAGVAINSTSARDLLTIRGPDSFGSGPAIQLYGEGSDQAESGRIRFVEGTATDNLRGAYLRYDGAANLLALGAHVASDALPSSEVDHIIMSRQATTRVGIGKPPGETLDVAGNIQIDGGVKFASVSNHSRRFLGNDFKELGESNCEKGNSFSIKKNGFTFDPCRANAGLEFPVGARLTELIGVFSDTDSGSNCSLSLSRVIRTGSSVDDSVLESVSTSGDNGGQIKIASLNESVSGTRYYVLGFTAASGSCALRVAEVKYELPDGFIP